MISSDLTTFWLGTHQPHWLARTDVHLFISDRRLRNYRTLPVARGPWALDSGGFTELSMHGTWANGPTPQQYADRVDRYTTEVGNLAWAAPQDWMCEEFIIAKTGLTVRDHQWRTIDNLHELREIAPHLPWVPVVQGWTVADYLRHVDLYRNTGIDLRDEPLVGVGSVCRRQGSGQIDALFEALHSVGVTRLHGFGLKKNGLRRSGHLLTSADSLAWSYEARRSPRLTGCVGHRNCANCMRYAMRWRADLLGSLTTSAPRQMCLPGVA